MFVVLASDGEDVVIKQQEEDKNVTSLGSSYLVVGA